MGEIAIAVALGAVGYAIYLQVRIGDMLSRQINLSAFVEKNTQLILENKEVISTLVDNKLIDHLINLNEGTVDDIIKDGLPVTHNE